MKRSHTLKKIVQAINRFRNKDRTVLAGALLYTAVWTLWAMIIVTLMLVLGWIHLDVTTLLQMGAKLFGYIFMCYMLYIAIIKIYLLFFHKTNFKDK